MAKALALAGLMLACLVLGGRIFVGGLPAGASIPRGCRSSAAAWAFAVAAVQPLFAADAWNNVTFLSEEVREPERNVPRALLLGTRPRVHASISWPTSAT